MATKATATITTTKTVAKPYLGLLMKEPPSQGCTAEEHKAICLYRQRTLFRRFRNKDWKSWVVFEDDDEDDEPRTPPPQESAEVQVKPHEDGSTVVIIDGEEVVDMIG